LNRRFARITRIGANTGKYLESLDLGADRTPNVLRTQPEPIPKASRKKLHAVLAAQPQHMLPIHLGQQKDKIFARFAPGDILRWPVQALRSLKYSNT